MDERSDLISKLRSEFETRAAYIRAKVSVLVPSQIRALRLKSEMPRQADLAGAADMKQSRISMLETPGAANVTLGTLSSIAAALKVGLVVKFVPFSEMLAWENNFSQDQFDVAKIDNDAAFLSPQPSTHQVTFAAVGLQTGRVVQSFGDALNPASAAANIMASPSSAERAIQSHDVPLVLVASPQAMGRGAYEAVGSHSC